MFIYAERLIEYAIRIGTDDLQKDPTLVDLAFFNDKQLNLGGDLTPPGGPTTKEPLPTDYFQMRLSQIPRKAQELSEDDGGTDIFKNSIPAIPDIKKYLSEANIKIVHGFPRDSTDLPCISITLGNEDEKQFLGVQKGVLLNPTTNKRYRIVGSDWPSQYNITVITPNYDETIVWYYILKYALSVYRPALEAYGMREQALSFGDVEPAPEYLQAGLFVYQRACVLSCVKSEDIPIKDEAYRELEFGIAGTDGGDGTIVPDPGAP